jgi:hypothetical protein
MHNDDYLKHASEDSVKQIILQIEKAWSNKIKP